MNLISGKEALIALANGENLQCRFPDGIWLDFTNNLNSNGSSLRVVDLLNDYASFRLKPRTININGIEVPAPFEPKKGEEYFIIHPAFKHGYTYNTFTDAERHKDFIKYGAWRTLEEIRQVVDALRKVFKEPQQ